MADRPLLVCIGASKIKLHPREREALVDFDFAGVQPFKMRVGFEHFHRRVHLGLVHFAIMKNTGFCPVFFIGSEGGIRTHDQWITFVQTFPSGMDYIFTPVA